MATWSRHRSFYARPLLFFAILVLAAAFLVGPTFVASTQADVPSAAEGIETESVLLRIVDRVDVPARVAGAMLVVNVEEGQVVEQGAAVARLDPTDAELVQNRARVELELASMRADNDVAVRSARAALDFAKSSFARLQRAAEVVKRSVSESELEKAREDVVQAELNLEDARHSVELAKVTQRLKANDVSLSDRNLELRTIVAPLAGVVTQIYKRPGEWVEPGDQVAQIVRVDRLRAEGFVRATDVTTDLHGAPVTLRVSLPGRADARFSGKVVFVHPEIDPVSGEMRVWAEVQNAEGLLRPGLRATMRIDTSATGGRTPRKPNQPSGR